MSGKSIVLWGVVGLVCAVLPVRAQAPAAAQLPEGNGKDAVQAYCVQCHGLNQVVNAGHTAQQWQTVVNMMINDGAKLPRDQVAMVTEYLVKNFPPKAAPSAVLIPGSVQVEIKEWEVPTPGSRPHDPLATPDGAIWYTGQMANVLGRLDPQTGDIKEYQIKTAQSGPHGLVDDKDGNIWFTANFKAYVGKLNPKTGEFTEYPMPDPAARDPHTPIFDQKGILWFTAQGANMVGRLDPKTGEVKLARSPTTRSIPTGWWSARRACRSSRSSGATRFPALIPTRWRFTNTRCPTRTRGLGASPSPAMTRSGTRTIPAATWAGWIPRPAR